MYWVNRDKPLNVSFIEWLLLIVMDALCTVTFDEWQWPAGVWCDKVMAWSTCLRDEGVRCYFF